MQLKLVTTEPTFLKPSVTILTVHCETMDNQTPNLQMSHLLHPIRVQEVVREWLKEDTPSFDFGGFVVGEKEETAVLLCKSPGVIAGAPFFSAVFEELNCQVEWLHPEGTFIDPSLDGPQTVATITGKVRHLLLGERVALNCITRSSGIASQARRLAQSGKDADWHGQVAGTRKTTPGFRMVEKYALLVGGMATHRHDLSSMIMLKDNHIWTAGDIPKAVSAAKSVGGFSTKIEVECRSVEEGKQAASAGADVVMLDNFAPLTLHKAAQQLKEAFPHIIIESSGGITESTLKDYMGPYIDIISLSRVTQGYDVVDFSFKIRSNLHDPANPLVKQL
ncbi:hypothetical protein CAPTEDRAFT_150616 [Capitella teleta]|uniref:Nicotinate-nucleotide pyrophosphorylase [carboxylating] n=1 Tax=Capitella teleta TaxID=283909 RepID=R7V523_CAPTE|nr:hypothetical protein CAPTEDRAFT_150616 [Capitella teleta]|eukprot:ELU13649.1 hypothetical protein CAPTEDRAFT_150616 [Capitella teleta]